MNARNTGPNGDRAGGPDEIEALLPWHAAGTLTPEQAKKVEEALARSPRLAAHFERVVEEREAAILSAEALGLPSSRAAERLFAVIEAEPERRPARANPLAALFGGLGARLARLGPTTLGLTAAAAMLALLIQGGALTGLLAGGEGYRAASGDAAPAGRATGGGAFVLVAFQPEARAAQIGTLLQSVQGRIVDGPYPGGLFKLRVGEDGMTAAERADVLDRLKQAGTIVRMASPAQ